MYFALLSVCAFVPNADASIYIEMSSDSFVVVIQNRDIMLAMTDRKQKSFTFAFSLVQATYWMTACAVLSYAVIYLQALSFSNFSIGIITAFGRVLGSLSGPLIASYLDSHPMFPTARMNTPLLLAQVALFALLQFFGRNNLITGMFFAMVAGLFIATNSVVLRFCGDCAVGGYKLNYGVARGIGSLAFIIPSVLMGILFKRIPATYLPAVGIILLVLQFAVNVYAGMFFKGQRSVSLQEDDIGSSPLIKFLREDPMFTRLLIGTSLLFFGYYSYNIFMINVVRNVGGDTAIMGIISGVGAAIEIPFMFLFSSLRKKWKISTLLTLSIIAFSLKVFITAMVSTIPALFATQILQGFGYALFAAAIVEYVSAVIPKRNLAKGQSLVYTMEMLSGVLASLVAGKLYDVTSVKTTLMVGFSVTVIGAAVFISGIKKVK